MDSVCLITSENDFEEIVSGEKPVVLLCMQCNEQFPRQLRILEAFAGRYGGQFKVGLMTGGLPEHFRKTMNISGTPTFLLMKNGKEVNRMLGITDQEALVGFAFSCPKEH